MRAERDALAARLAVPGEEELDVLVASLRERAGIAREEDNATARADAWYFDKSADAITALDDGQE